jgi:hypothetical protein
MSANGPFAAADVVGAFCPECAASQIAESGGGMFVLQHEPEGSLFPLGRVTVTSGATLFVAMITLSVGPQTVVAVAAKIASASSSWAAAVGNPRLRTKAQNSAALCMIRVVSGWQSRLAVKVSNRFSPAVAPPRINSRRTS